MAEFSTSAKATTMSSSSAKRRKLDENVRTNPVSESISSPLPPLSTIVIEKPTSKTQKEKDKQQEAAESASKQQSTISSSSSPSGSAQQQINNKKTTNTATNTTAATKPSTVKQQQHHQQQRKAKFTFCHCLELEHAVWGISFSRFSSPTLMALCGERCVSLVTETDNFQTPYVRVEDSNEEEDYYTCTFGADTDYDGKNHQYVCVAGKHKMIQVIQVSSSLEQPLHCTLIGHVDEVLDLTTHPSQTNVILSASKDTSCRLWNITTQSCIAILGGHGGHRDLVATCAWHPDGIQIASGGMDLTLKLWSVEDSTTRTFRLKKAIAKTQWSIGEMKQYRQDFPEREPMKMYVKPIIEHYPIFSTNKVHSSCIDCVQYVKGQNKEYFLLTKGADERIVLWQPIFTSENETPTTKTPFPPEERLPIPSNVLPLKEFKTPFLDRIWYVRFGFHCYTTTTNTSDNTSTTTTNSMTLAVGNSHGQISVWDDIRNYDTTEQKISSTFQKNILVRGTTFSPNGTHLFSVADNGVCIWKIE